MNEFMWRRIEGPLIFQEKKKDKINIVNNN